MKKHEERLYKILGEILDSELNLGSDILVNLPLADLQDLEKKLDSWVDVISSEIHWRDA